MRKIIKYSVMIVSFLSMAACTKQIEKKIDVDSNKIEGKIEVWTVGISEGFIEQYIERFKEEQNKISINNTYIKEEEFKNKLTESFNSALNMPDIMIITDDSINQVKNLDSKVTYKPWYITPRVMFYRQDIFQESDVKVEDIKTWNDYIEAGKSIFNHTNGKVKLLPLNILNDSSFFRQLLNQQSGSYYDKQGKVQLSSEHAIKSMGILKELYDSNIYYNTSNEEDIIKASKNNEIASIPYSSNIIAKMRENLEDQTGKWGIMNIPAFEPGGMTESVENTVYICNNKEVPHNKAAVELRSFLENNKKLEKDFIVNKGIFPVTSQLYDDPFMDEVDTYFNNQKIWRYLVSIIKDSSEFPVRDRLNELEVEIIKAQEMIIVKNKDINSVLKDIDTQINETRNKN